MPIISWKRIKWQVTMRAQRTKILNDAPISPKPLEESDAVVGREVPSGEGERPGSESPGPWKSERDPAWVSPW